MFLMNFKRINNSNNSFTLMKILWIKKYCNILLIIKKFAFKRIHGGALGRSIISYKGVSFIFVLFGQFV